MNKSKYAIALMACCIVAVAGCAGKTAGNTAQQTADEAKEITFDADSAYSFVARQCAFGERVPNTDAHSECGDWIASRLRQCGATVTEQRVDLKAFDGTLLHARNIVGEFYPEKKRYLDANRETLQKDNRKARNKTYSPEKYKLYRASLSEEKKAELREKSRLRMQRLRAENPEKATADARKYWRQMPQEKKDYQRIVSRGRNRKYREENREAIRSRNNERRRRLKEENPELLKEIDRRHNQNANRQQSCREYYLKNKEKIAAKAKENPKVKEYKRRYKLKQRFRNSTGRTILALLQGIADSKAGR